MSNPISEREQNSHNNPQSPSRSLSSTFSYFSSTTLKAPLFSASSRQTLFNFFGATFGIGSLGLPVIMAQSGVGLYFLLLLIAVAINYASYRTILIYAEIHHLSHFPGFTQAVGGPRLLLFSNIFFLLSNLGTMLGALIVFNSLFTLIFGKIGITAFLLTDPKSLFWVLVPTLMSFPLLLKQKLTHFTWVTVLSLISCIYFVGLLIVTLFFSRPGEQKENKSLEYFNWSGFTKTYSYLFYCLVCQQNIIGIYRESGCKSFAAIKPTIDFFTAAFTILYGTIGLAGYLAFSGRKDELIGKELVLKMYAENNIFALLAIFLMTFTAFNAFLFTFKPTKEIIFELLSGFFRENNPNEARPNELTANSGQVIEEINFVNQPQRKVAEEMENDFSARNLVTTICLAGGLMIFAGFIIRKEIGFVAILNFIGDLITPALFVFIPLVVYFRDSHKAYVLGMIFFSALIYVWRVFELGAKIFSKTQIV